MRSFVMYVWTSRIDAAAISTCDEAFAEQLKDWAEQQGYRVEMPDGWSHGPEHK